MAFRDSDKTVTQTDIAPSLIRNAPAVIDARKGMNMGTPFVKVKGTKKNAQGLLRGRFERNDSATLLIETNISLKTVQRVTFLNGRNLRALYI